MLLGPVEAAPVKKEKFRAEDPDPRDPNILPERDQSHPEGHFT